MENDQTFSLVGIMRQKSNCLLRTVAARVVQLLVNCWVHTDRFQVLYIGWQVLLYPLSDKLLGCLATVFLARASSVTMSAPAPVATPYVYELYESGGVETLEPAPVAELESELSALRARQAQLTPEHPRWQELQDDIEDLETRIEGLRAGQTAPSSEAAEDGP